MMMRNIFPGLGLLAFICSSVPAAEYDWPQWRGPNRDGICAETGLLQQWPASGPPQAWKAAGLGSGYASVAVAKNRIYTMGEKGSSTFLIALDEASGKSIWSVTVGQAASPGGYDGPRCTPTVDGDLIFCLSQRGELVAIDTAGKEVWRKHLAKDFSGEEPDWGYAESPLIDGEKILVTPGGAKGAIVALNKNSGQLLWQTAKFTDPAHYSSMVKASIADTPQYIQLTPASVVGISLDGTLLWRAARRGATAVIPTPVVHENMVYVTSGYAIGCNLFQVTREGSGFNASQVYANRVMVNHHGGVVRLGNHVYGYSDGKGWTCQDLKTGQAVWQEKSKVGKGSILYAEGRLYLRAEDGPVGLIEASPAGYKQLGFFNQPDRSDKNSWPHPVISHGKLYLRDQDILLCYNVRR